MVKEASRVVLVGMDGKRLVKQLGMVMVDLGDGKR